MADNEWSAQESIFVRYLPDAVALAKVQAVDLDDVAILADVTVCSDNTVVSAPGTIQRTIIGTFNDLPQAKLTTNEVRQAYMEQRYKDALMSRLPLDNADIEEVVVVAAGLCP